MTVVGETRLPGVGSRYDFETRDGDHIGVIARRGGNRDLLLYDPADDDTCRATVALSADDAHTLVELLGGSQVTESLRQLETRIRGLVIEWIAVADASELAGRTLAQTQLRQRTGCSVIAVVRGDSAEVAPGPDHIVAGGDGRLGVGRRRMRCCAHRGGARGRDLGVHGALGRIDESPLP